MIFSIVHKCNYVKPMICSIAQQSLLFVASMLTHPSWIKGLQFKKNPTRLKANPRESTRSILETTCDKI